MSPKQIKTALALRGYSVTLVAQALYKTPGLISKVVNKKATSRPIAEAIAKLIDVPLEEAFPEVCETSRAKANELKRNEKLEEIRSKLKQ